MRYRAILFDLDGTLIDDYPHYAYLMQLVAKRFIYRLIANV